MRTSVRSPSSSTARARPARAVTFSAPWCASAPLSALFSSIEPPWIQPFRPFVGPPYVLAQGNIPDANVVINVTKVIRELYRWVDCNECPGMGFETLSCFSPAFEAFGGSESVVILVEYSRHSTGLLECSYASTFDASARR